MNTGAYVWSESGFCNCLVKYCTSPITRQKFMFKLKATIRKLHVAPRGIAKLFDLMLTGVAYIVHISLVKSLAVHANNHVGKYLVSDNKGHVNIFFSIISKIYHPFALQTINLCWAPHQKATKSHARTRNYLICLYLPILKKSFITQATQTLQRGI